ncbi:DNA-directed RNA polymerase I subunit RPA1, partial [Fragariocoptes setiger]
MATNVAIGNVIERASFGLWTANDIRRISVKQVTNTQTFNKDGTPTDDGLYQSALGPMKRGVQCATCNQSDMLCNGHYGHIELEAPVYHPLLMRTAVQIVAKSCIECHRFMLPLPSLKLFLAQLEAIYLGFDYLVDELIELAEDFSRQCGDGEFQRVNADKLSLLLEARIEQERKSTGVGLPRRAHQRPQLRSIVERHQKLFRGFINNKTMKPSRQCDNCSARRHALTVINNSGISISNAKGAKRAASLKGTKPTEMRGKSRKEQLAEKLPSSGSYADTDDIEEDKTNYDLLVGDGKRFLTPIGMRTHLRQLWINERETMEKIFHFLSLKPATSPVMNQHVKTEDESREEKALDGGDTEKKDSLKKSKSKKFEPVDIFFLDTIFVEPTRFRPVQCRLGRFYEGAKTAALSQIMLQSTTVGDLMHQIDETIREGSDPDLVEKLKTKLSSAWQRLQTFCNRLYDSDMDRYADKKYPGLKQLIDKKQGLFRKHMMGKRVNFAARSVISPDPNIKVDEIGVPLVFATKLTYPTPITIWNMRQLRESVINGPNKWPGAVSIQFEDGQIVRLKANDLASRRALALRLRYRPVYSHSSARRDNSDQSMPASLDGPEVILVNRHLVSGDLLLFNRQPTLHKPSIMAFKARVLPNEKGFRLHYANCKCFNADFDGDEMNAHFVQNELARSEALNIASVNHQYLVPKDGSPLGGLIQDHIVATCLLTTRDKFLDRELYQQLCYAGLSFLGRKLILEPPTIIKPKELWTGKQVVTTLIRNCCPPDRRALSLTIDAKIGPKVAQVFPAYVHLSDCRVIIRDGQLLTGYIDKANIGATHYGLVHMCYELYGGETSSNMMSAFSRLATIYLQIHEGFTLGILDILVDEASNQKRAATIETSTRVGDASACEALGIDYTTLTSVDMDAQHVLIDKLMEAHASRDPLPMKQLDGAMKARTDKLANTIAGHCLPVGLYRKFPHNNLQMMIQSGAKGGTVNALQISCLLGQIELEGRRVPLSMSGRTLPSFAPYDTSPRAGGFVSGRFLTGIRPQEFFFHCMAGREGLIDTAVKTSRSGYLQRCLIKHLEGLTVHYDHTVRDSCGSIIQFLYGEDGVDVLRSQMLKSAHSFQALIDNYDIVAPGNDELKRLEKMRAPYDEEFSERRRELDEWRARNGPELMRKLRGSGFLDYLASQLNESSSALVTSNRSKSYQDSHTSSQESQDEDRTKSPRKGKKNMKAVMLAPGIDFHAQVFDSWYTLSFKEKRKWNRHWCPCPDPLVACLPPGSLLGSIPEKLEQQIEQFARQSHSVNSTIDSSCLQLSNTGKIEKVYSINVEQFVQLIQCWFMRTLASPGEPVGLLAAQSIGEPSTQMTLNTFHFAGRGEMNVTLGIPRLREILMTASAKIGTPNMDIPFLPVGRIFDETTGEPLTVEQISERAQRVRRTLNAVRLSDVLEFVDIREKLIDDPRGSNNESSSTKRRTRSSTAPKTTELSDRSSSRKWIQYKLELNFLPSRYYRHEYKSSSARILHFIEARFVEQFIDVINKRLKRLKKQQSSQLIDLVSTNRRRTANHDLDEDDAEAAVVDSSSGGSGNNGADADNGCDREEEELEEYNRRARRTARDDSSSEDDDDDDDEEPTTGSSTAKGGSKDAGDATSAKAKSRRDQELEYDEPDDEDLDAEALDAGSESGGATPDTLEHGDDKNYESVLNPDVTNGSAKMIKAEDDDDDDDEHNETVGDQRLLADVIDKNDDVEDDEDDDDYDQKSKSKRRKSDKLRVNEQTRETRRRQIRSLSSHIIDYDFDARRERWCHLTLAFPAPETQLDMAALIEFEARRTYVYRVGQIRRALLVKDVNVNSKSKLDAQSKLVYDQMIKTEGVSLLSLVRLGHVLDLTRVYSNDVHAVAATYGIEAAAHAIKREIASVFAVYGIQVDARHLSLIGDYMTYNGSIRGMNRMSMEASASPLQQMTFESTANYLKSATLLGLHDDIRSPSARLIMGRPTRGGTGLVQLLARRPAANETYQHSAFQHQKHSASRKRAHPGDDTSANVDVDVIHEPSWVRTSRGKRARFSATEPLYF